MATNSPRGPRQASYDPEDVGTGTPYTGDGRMGDTRHAGRQSTNGSKRGFTRSDMAKSYSQHCDGSRKRSVSQASE